MLGAVKKKDDLRGAASVWDLQGPASVLVNIWGDHQGSGHKWGWTSRQVRKKGIVVDNSMHIISLVIFLLDVVSFIYGFCLSVNSAAAVVLVPFAGTIVCVGCMGRQQVSVWCVCVSMCVQFRLFTIMGCFGRSRNYDSYIKHHVQYFYH